MIKWKILPHLILAILSVFPVMALEPLESLILGDLEDKVGKVEKSPIDELFESYENGLKEQGELKLPLGYKKTEGQDKNYFLKNRVKLGLYRGFVEEGYNLENKCKTQSNIQFASKGEELQARRNYLALVQFEVLSKTINHLPSYAKFFEYSSDDYSNMVDYLVGNFCSHNLTLISHKQLKKYMNFVFENSKGDSFPSVKDNPYFPEQLSKIESRLSTRKNEFAWSVELFKSACSWNGNPSNLGLLVPLLRSPAIGALISRKLDGKEIIWDDKKEEILLVNDKSDKRVVCENLICRKRKLDDFYRLIPRSVGSTDIKSDYERLYCNHFRDADYNSKNQRDERVKEIIKNYTFDDRNLLVNQFMALETGVPDFLVQAEIFKELETLTRASVDRTWDYWSFKQREGFSKKIAFEESLTVEILPNNRFLDELNPKFEVNMDINQGEFDKAVYSVGKLKTKMNLRFSKKIVKWARGIWKNLDKKKNPKTMERVMLPFKKIVGDVIEEQIESYPVVPFKKVMDDLIVEEFLDQVAKYDGPLFKGEVEGFLDVPVYFNYGVFALRHLHDRFTIKKNEGEIEGELQKLRALRL